MISIYQQEQSQDVGSDLIPCSPVFTWGTHAHVFLIAVLLPYRSLFLSRLCADDNQQLPDSGVHILTYRDCGAEKAASVGRAEHENLTKHKTIFKTRLLDQFFSNTVTCLCTTRKRLGPFLAAVLSQWPMLMFFYLGVERSTFRGSCWVSFLCLKPRETSHQTFTGLPLLQSPLQKSDISVVTLAQKSNTVRRARTGEQI